MKCTSNQIRSNRPCDLKTKAMISCGAGGLSALFGSGLLCANPNWMMAIFLFAIAISVALICFFVPWCPKQIEPNPE